MYLYVLCCAVLLEIPLKKKKKRKEKKTSVGFVNLFESLLRPW